MAVMGTLVTTLAVDATKYQKGLDDAGGGTQSFAASAAGWLNPVTAAFAAIAASAAAAGLSIYGIAQRIGELAKIDDKAAQTGLSGKFIQQLGFAADQSGVSIDEFTSAISKMTVNIGKGELGAEKVGKSLEKMGLDLASIEQMKPEEQFLAIAEAISQLPNEAQRAAAGAEIFGKGMIKLNPLLSDGEKGIKALTDQAAALGIGLEAADFKDIATADDAMSRMSASLSNVITQIAVGLAPVFTQMSDGITMLLPSLAELARGLSEGVATAMKMVGDIMVNDIIPPIKEFLTGTAEAVSLWSKMDNKFEFLGKLIEASFQLAMEHIKLYWREMFKDLLDYAAEKAGQLANMLNPKTALNAVSDYLTGQGADKVDPNNSRAALDSAQHKFDNLMRELHGLPPILSAAETAAQAAAKVVPGGPMSAAGAPMGAGGKPAFSPGMWSMLQGGKPDPNIKATQDQTAALLRGLKPPAPQFVGVVEGF